MFSFSSPLTAFIFVIVFVFIVSGSVKVLMEYERAVVFTLGRFTHVSGPGLIFLIPWFQQMVRVDLRTVVMEIPSQDLISRDNVSVTVDAAVYFHVANPEKAVIAIEHFAAATNLLAQTTLRSVLGQHDLDDLLAARAKLNSDIADILLARTADWGIEVSAVEIRDVRLGENMIKAIAKQAEAERDRRAKVIHAEAEFQASQTLADAANVLTSVPAAMQLRYLQTLAEVGGEQNSTVIFPMPLDIVKPFLSLLERDAARATNPVRR
jgi:regulator of protease activity HflC (stomatin/prohibitin superfamily)